MANLFTTKDVDDLDIRAVHELYRQHVSPSLVNLTKTFPFGRDRIVRAQGAHIFTQDGRRILDFTGGVGVLNHGHNHPRILAARQAFQASERMEVHKAFFSPYVAALSANIARLLPGDLEVSYFPNSGAEANEGAIKMAYKYHGGRRQTILRADISFHGKTLGAGSLTGSSENSFAFPGITGRRQYRYGDVADLRAVIRDARDARGRCDVYALLVEPFSASTMRAWSEEDLYEIQEMCRAEDIILIFDEVYTGWGKTGSLFYFMRYPDLVPDILTYSKSLGGGKASISGYTARRPVFAKAYDSLADVILHSTTYYGFGEETFTAIEAVNVVVEEDFPAKARDLERLLQPGLERLQKAHHKLVGKVAGTGGLFGVFIDGGPAALNTAARLAPGFAKDPQFRAKLVTCSVIAALYKDHGVLTYYSPNGANPLVVAPPLVTDPDDVEYFLDSLDATLSQGLPRLLAGFVQGKLSPVS